MRLASNALWPIPVTLDVSEAFAEKLSSGDRIVLRHPEGMVLAVMTVSDIWAPDRAAEAWAVLDTADEKHPGVFQLLHQTNPVYLGRSVEGIELPPHHRFSHLRHTPCELRSEFARRGWNCIVALQTRNPMHNGHIELARRALESVVGAHLLIHPVVGEMNPGDINYVTRVRCYEKALKLFEPDMAMLSLLPLRMRMAGPREAIWHALVRRNYGCTHMIVGRDHAGPGEAIHGKSFYGPYDAQELAKKYESELGITILPVEEVVYSLDHRQYMFRSQVPDDAKILSLSGRQLRRMLTEGAEIPDYYCPPEIVRALRESHPPRDQQGFTVFFTGLSASGKSTIARILQARLMEIDTRRVTLLDGDVVRKSLSSELGFSKEHRDLNVRRVSDLASEITKNRGAAICALIAPYVHVRREARGLISGYGGFIEVYVATPRDVCERRDRKGLYAKVWAGRLRGFTGIDDPYEPPANPEIILDTSGLSAL